MRTDAQLVDVVDDDAEAARRAEAAGHDTLWIAETSSDPFLRCLLAAEATTDIGIGTCIAVAFARTPMTVAVTAYDLQRYTGGRFTLGLGTQIKAHIERRFSMPWSHPAPRMREFVLALKHIWSCWQDGTRLEFEGEFYTHTLAAPFFTPPRHEWGAPPVFLSAVGETMTETVGEVAEGWFWHAFTTQRFLREVSLPAIERGRAKAGLGLDGFTCTGPVLVATGRTQAELDAALHGVKKQISFYASTPAYRAVLDVHGWGELQPELQAMSKRGLWDEMAGLVHDDLLHAMAVVGSVDEVGPMVRERWSDVARTVSLFAPYESDPTLWDAVAAAVRR